MYSIVNVVDVDNKPHTESDSSTPFYFDANCDNFWC